MLRSEGRVPVSSGAQEDRHCDDIYEDLCALRRRSAFYKVARQRMRNCRSESVKVHFACHVPYALFACNASSKELFIAHWSSTC